MVNKIPTASERVNPPLDPAPLERSSAFVDTYPLGAARGRAKATFRWDVSAVKAGPYKLCWRVNAGLYGKAKAVASGGSPISGMFEGTISNVGAEGHGRPRRQDRHRVGRLTGSSRARTPGTRAPARAGSAGSARAPSFERRQRLEARAARVA